MHTLMQPADDVRVRVRAYVQLISLPFEQRDLWRGARGRVRMCDRTEDPPARFEQLIVDQAVCVFVLFSLLLASLIAL